MALSSPRKREAGLQRPKIGGLRDLDVDRVRGERNDGVGSGVIGLGVLKQGMRGVSEGAQLDKTRAMGRD